MNIYKLEPCEDMPIADNPWGPEYDNPWEPWYDKCFGMVVAATDESDARKVAAEHCECEGYDAWIAPRYTNCTMIGVAAEGSCRGVIIRSIHWA